PRRAGRRGRPAPPHPLRAHRAPVGVVPAESVAIYTALFGGHDRLLEQPPIDAVDFVCFSDDPTLQSRTWEIRLQPRREHPRRAARDIKTSPDRHLPDHDWTIWVDARLSI